MQNEYQFVVVEYLHSHKWMGIFTFKWQRNKTDEKNIQKNTTVLVIDSGSGISATTSRSTVSLSIHDILFVCDRLYSVNDLMTLKSHWFDVAADVVVIVAVAVAGWLLVSFRLIVAVCFYYQCWHSTVNKNDFEAILMTQTHTDYRLSIFISFTTTQFGDHTQTFQQNPVKHTTPPLIEEAKW